MNATAAVLLVLGLAVAGLPIAATLLVTIASKREDSQWTLSGPPPGLMQAAARRLLAFRSEVGWAQSRRQPAPPWTAMTASQGTRLQLLDTVAAIQHASRPRPATRTAPGPTAVNSRSKPLPATRRTERRDRINVRGEGTSHNRHSPALPPALDVWRDGICPREHSATTHGTGVTHGRND